MQRDRSEAIFGPSLEDLLRPVIEPGAHTIHGPEETINARDAAGAFFGVRSALIVYACLGIACGVAYEIWSLLSR